MTGLDALEARRTELEAAGYAWNGEYGLTDRRYCTRDDPATGRRLVQAWRDSPTYDEKYHLSGGVTALTDHQLRLTPEHPPLPKVLAALPALAEHPVIPHGEAWRKGDGFTYPDQFLQAQLDAGKLQRVTFASRLVPLAIAVGVGWVLYALAASLFGRAAGLLAGGLWLTTPFVMYGLFRYLYLIYVKGQGGQPETALLGDPPSLFNFALWTLVVIGIFYFSR